MTMETRVSGATVSSGMRLDGWADPASSAQVATAASSLTTLASEPTLRQGARGAAVTKLQGLLAQAGFNPGAADGVFGPATSRALKGFQKAAHLTADGICGKKSWAALESSFEPAPPAQPRPTLKQGSRGSAVVELQGLLQKAGIPVGVDGSFGPGTKEAVEAYQYSRGLKVDGVVGSGVWSALVSGKGEVDHTPSAQSQALRGRILDVARSQLGMHEATNHNDGEILKYPHAFGRHSESWCADFVSWVSTQSGKSLNYAYTPYLLNHLKDAGQWKGKNDPTPGDIILFDINGDGRADHTGFVESVNPDGSVNTIEGNTLNEATGVEGVWRRHRDLDVIIGFGRPS
jgi:peptidoglycan hydrolase-like protein with peptidoglycan-binding domain